MFKGSITTKYADGSTVIIREDNGDRRTERILYFTEYRGGYIFKHFVTYTQDDLLIRHDKYYGIIDRIVKQDYSAIKFTDENPVVSVQDEVLFGFSGYNIQLRQNKVVSVNTRNQSDLQAGNADTTILTNHTFQKKWGNMSIYKQLLNFTLMMIILPLSVQAVELTGIDNGRKISVSEGESISVILAGNPTTGYRWELVTVDGAVLTADAKPLFTADSSLTGSGGKFKFCFTPLKTGSTAIKLIYHRPWEKDQKPIQTFEAFVSVTADKPQINSASYRSAMGEVVKASFDLNLNQVTISLPDGRNLTLPSAPSASGARYSNGNETFWEHQGVGRFFKEDNLLFEGTELRNNDKNQK